MVSQFFAKILPASAAVQIAPQSSGNGAAATPSSFPRRIDTIAREAQGRFVVVLCGVLVLMIAWASVTQIDKVTRGSGRIVPQQHKQEVQHLEGGIVAEILVKEGDRVAPGQALMRIENSFFQAELAQAKIELTSKRLRLIRLAAEIALSETIDFPNDLKESDPRETADEISLFKIQRANLDQQLQVLDQQHKQKEIEISALTAREPSLMRERQIAEERLTSMQKLSAAGAASTNDRLLADEDLQQATTRLSDLIHEIPKTESSMAELDERKVQLKSQFQADAEKERNQVLVDVEKLNQSISALQDRTRRTDVLAPIAGVINKLDVTTVGGVVKPGETVAEIVPDDKSITVEMKLQPSDRGEVWPGQKAVVKISAYEYSMFGGLPAEVADISPDALQDERGASYFRVRLDADASNFGADHPILPGMTADVDVLGERQSVLASVLKPLRRIKDNALRQ